MTTITDLRQARERLEEAQRVVEFVRTQVHRVQQDISLDELAKGIVTSPEAVCMPVRRAHAREGDPDLRLICTSQSDVGIVLESDLRDKGEFSPHVRLKAYPQGCLRVASAWQVEGLHLGELVQEHRLRGVVLGVKRVERRNHALAYNNDLALLNLTDILADIMYFTDIQRKVREVSDEDLPFLTLHPVRPI